MLYALPLCFALVGLALYGVLGGADFGAGFWQLTAGSGENAERIREHAHHSMAPVWEANHVWLIFVLTVIWTAYPKAFGSLASTLSVALMVAAIGIIFRGATYALRSGTSSRREQRAIDTAFGISSVITPFALGAALGGIASGRVPVGNAAGGLFSSWLNPTSILVGVLAVLTGAYLAAVFLSGDAVRAGDQELAQEFRLRALGSGLVAGAAAIGGLIVLHGDAHPLYHQLTGGTAVVALIISVIAGVATLALVWFERFELARFSAAAAVAAIVAGWAIAQNPQFLPGLTVRQAAAPHDTQVAVLVAILAGGAILLPSLATLFSLLLGGSFGAHGAERASEPPAVVPAAARAVVPSRPALLVRVAAALLIAGIGFTNVADAGWAHLLGAACFIAFVVVAFRVVVPLELSAPGTDVSDP
jgi:cytochrome bd ubiquinol oxidase subunit II